MDKKALFLYKHVLSAKCNHKIMHSISTLRWKCSLLLFRMYEIVQLTCNQVYDRCLDVKILLNFTHNLSKIYDFPFIL
jgi:hypothetical protein